MRICDAHCHFFSTRFLELLTAGVPGLPDTARGSAVSHRLGWDDPRGAEELSDRWIAELDRHNVARAALIASIPGDESSVEAAVARHTDRLVGFFMFNRRSPFQSLILIANPSSWIAGSSSCAPIP